MVGDPVPQTINRSSTKNDIPAFIEMLLKVDQGLLATCQCGGVWQAQVLSKVLHLALHAWGAAQHDTAQHNTAQHSTTSV